MNKLKLFIENFLVYGLGGIISKVIPLIMVPIIAKIMPTTEYFGISDMATTIVSLFSALAVMGMYDAMYRMFFEKKEEMFQKTVCSTALVFTFFSSVLVFVVMVLLRNFLAVRFLTSKDYAFVVCLTAIATLVGATNSIISAPTRMLNKRKIFLVTNTVGPIISYGISIPILLAGHYVVALPLAAVISGLTLEISFAFLNYKWFNPKLFDKAVLKQLLEIAIPLLPNFLIYWVFNSSDRLMITNLIGVGQEGVYAAGSKLGQCSQLIYLAFAGGWQYFAFSTMKEKNQVENNSKVFEYLGVISFSVTSFVCVFSYPLFDLFFKKEYLHAYIVAPYLFLAPLLQMLFQVAGNQFLVVKKTWPSFFILSLGAVANVGINLFLIPVMGIEGASLATLIGYIISDVLCVIVLCKMKLMIVSSRFIVASGIMTVFFVAWRFLFDTNFVLGIIAALILTCIYILLYKEDFMKLKNIKPSSENKDV